MPVSKKNKPKIKHNTHKHFVKNTGLVESADARGVRGITGKDVSSKVKHITWRVNNLRNSFVVSPVIPRTPTQVVPSCSGVLHKDGNIEEDKYVRVNHNGKIRNKHMHRVFTPRLMKNVKGMDGRCNSLFPGRHTRRNLPNTKTRGRTSDGRIRRTGEDLSSKMIADVPELMSSLSMNVRKPKIVTFNPNIIETEYSMGRSSPILIRQHGLMAEPNNQPFPVSTKIDRMPVSNDIVFLDGFKPKKKRVKRRSHKKPTSIET